MNNNRIVMFRCDSCGKEDIFPYTKENEELAKTLTEIHYTETNHELLGYSVLRVDENSYYFKKELLK
jgi:hypothetical protein